MSWPNGPHGSYVFIGLEEARYRLQELRSGVTSEIMELIGPRCEATVHLDLRSSCLVRGRIEAPAGTDLTRCRLRRPFLCGGGRPSPDPAAGFLLWGGLPLLAA